MERLNLEYTDNKHVFTKMYAEEYFNDKKLEISTYVGRPSEN